MHLRSCTVSRLPLRWRSRGRLHLGFAFLAAWACRSCAVEGTLANCACANPALTHLPPCRRFSSAVRATLQDEERELLGDGCEVLHRTATLANGVSLHFVESGPADGPTVLLLHGFPDLHLSWRLQLPALSVAGYRAVAVDMRGYGRSSAPPGVRSYSRDAIVGDLLALLDLLVGVDGAVALLVGHDWGAAVAWAVAELAPERVARLATLNVPHPAVFRRTLRESAEQRRRSWYILAFQLPWLPERLLKARDCRALRRVLGGSTAPPPPPALIEQYVAAFTRPGGGGFQAPLNFYRAAARGLWPTSERRIEAPVLVLWGEQDPYLEAAMATPPAHLAPNARVVRIPSASHWVHWEEPETVNRELLALLLAPVTQRP